MANISKPIQGTETTPVKIEGTQPDEEKKERAGHQDKHPHHSHHHHSPRIIRPVSSGTSHLDPGAILIKP